jgi:hypothetical protein
MDSRRATVRNVRSKCRCSCVLQFTFRRAVSCVLHRPPSQVIHCTVLSFFQSSGSTSEAPCFKNKTNHTSHHGEGLKHNPGKGEAPWTVRISSRRTRESVRSTEYRTQDPGHPPTAETSTVSSGQTDVTPGADRLEARGVTENSRGCFYRTEQQ